MIFVDRLIEAALAEDIGTGDVTTDALIPEDLPGSARITAKEPLVLAGLEIAGRVFGVLSSGVVFTPEKLDGQAVGPGETVCRITGPMRALLKGERTALNFLQRLSGIATCVREWMQAPGADGLRLVDTRKTTPGWRALEKYAVRMGGGRNHRMGLFDGVLIKDNHIDACGGMAAAVARARERLSHLMKIEVEADSLSLVQEALDAGADVIMLDNMDDCMVREAVALIDGRALVEVSGSIRKERLQALADIGVDVVSVGALTHSARSVDLSMRLAATSPRGGATP